MADIITSYPTMVLQILDGSIVMRFASHQGAALKEVLRAHIGETVVPSGDYTKKCSGPVTCLAWRTGILRVVHEALGDGVHRYDILWTAGKINKLLDSFELGDARWFGGAQTRRMVWPMDKMKFKMAPFVAGDSYKSGEYGGVQERYWLSSKGVALFVRPDAPLFVGVNEGGSRLLRLCAKYESPYRNNTKSYLQLRYSVYHGPDMMATHLAVAGDNIRKPVAIPDVTMFRFPIWSTWVICKDAVDQEKVMALAEQIKRHGIRTSYLQIDDHWASHRGDWHFNRDKFPNPHEMARRLKELGFRIAVSVHPFANLKSDAIRRSELFVKGAARGAVRWWNGVGRVVDVTKPEAVQWFRGELGRLREEYGVTSFKFDGGEAVWLPKKWRLAKACDNPNLYARRYARLAYDVDREIRSAHVRVGVRTQKLPIFVRMSDKDSVWSGDNGLRSVVPQALLYGLLGYPFFIPDVVGGNAYDDDRPTKSLYVRWLQLCTLMPCVQFSLPPWWYDDQTVRIARRMLALRARYSELLIELAREATQTGHPIVRPLWWVAPQDDFALGCDDQFLVGNDLLVAPVLTEGAKTRPIYLPSGKWLDEQHGRVYEGNKWYFDYPVTIEDLPYFIRQKQSEDELLVDIRDDPTIPLTPVSLHGDVSKREREQTGENINKHEQSQMAKGETSTTEATSSGQTDNLANPDDNEAPDDDPLPPPPPPITEQPSGDVMTDVTVDGRAEQPADGVTEDITRQRGADDEASGLAGLLRRKLERDLEELGPDEDMESFIRGKYRFSRLNEEISEDCLAELSDVASTADSGEDRADGEDSSDDELMVTEDDDVMEELGHVMRDQLHQSADIGASLATEEVTTGDQKTRNVDLENITTGQQQQQRRRRQQQQQRQQQQDCEVSLKSGLGAGFVAELTEAVSGDLDTAVPPPLPARCQVNRLDRTPTDGASEELYENVTTDRSGEAAASGTTPSGDPGATPPEKPGSTELEQRRRSTLWDELTEKLRGMPKFDPDVELFVDGKKTTGTQTCCKQLGVRILTTDGVSVATQTGSDTSDP